VNEDVVRVLAPQVPGILVRRGNDFAAAEDAAQDALLEAHRFRGDAPPGDLKGWLLTVAGRKLIDARRSEAARRHPHLVTSIAADLGLPVGCQSLRFGREVRTRHEQRVLSLRLSQPTAACG
jgi:DNA-directed RNA polymerase specialized sigma24 family protein